jgi:hypothetical protein
MSLFDLFFLALALAAAGTLVAALITAARGRWARALTILTRLLICAAVYIGIVYLSAALSKRLVLHVGDPQCNDDWCFAVDNVKRTPHEDRVAYDVSLRIFSRALRVDMHENGARDVYLVDSAGRRYDPIPRGTEVPLNTLVHAGESIPTMRFFDVPAKARGLGLIVERQGFPGPVCLVIGECDQIHGPPIVYVPPAILLPASALAYN